MVPARYPPSSGHPQPPSTASATNAANAASRVANASLNDTLMLNTSWPETRREPGRSPRPKVPGSAGRTSADARRDQRRRNLLRPGVDLLPVAEVSVGEHVLHRGKRIDQPVREVQLRVVEGAEEDMMVARPDRSRELRDLLWHRCFADIPALSVDGGCADGTAAEEPDRLATQPGSIPADKIRGLFHPREHVGGASHDERVVALQRAALPAGTAAAC